VATSNQVKRLLVVEDNKESRRAIVSLVSGKDVVVDEASGAQDAIEAILSRRYDCMILDLGLWDMDGEKLLEAIEKDEHADLPPVVVYTGRDLSREEEMRLREYTESIIIKDVRSEERLLDEVSLFLHRVVRDMPAKKRQVIVNLHDSDVMFQDKNVLIVDDDMRSAFALAKMLSERGMNVVKAEDGKRALEILSESAKIDLVLMDIMMPVMDGYEAMSKVRQLEHYADIPIIALTAKAMPEDRAKCIAAGASEYLTKPVDLDKLLSMLRVWLYRHVAA
jgi:CheY-like chemotaxis protein